MANDTSGRVKGETVKPTNTLELVKRVGVTRAHQLLGVSTTTLHKARRERTVSRVVEVAASHIVPTVGEDGATKVAATAAPRHAAQQHSGDGDTVVVLVDIRRDKVASLEKIARALGAGQVIATD